MTAPDGAGPRQGSESLCRCPCALSAAAAAYMTACWADTRAALWLLELAGAGSTAAPADIVTGETTGGIKGARAYRRLRPLGVISSQDET